MKKWLGMLGVLILLVGGCSDKESVKVNDDVSKDNPSGDLAPLRRKQKLSLQKMVLLLEQVFILRMKKGILLTIISKWNLRHLRIVMTCCQPCIWRSGYCRRYFLSCIL